MSNPVAQGAALVATETTPFVLTSTAQNQSDIKRSPGGRNLTAPKRHKAAWRRTRERLGRAEALDNTVSRFGLQSTLYPALKEDGAVGLNDNLAVMTTALIADCIYDGMTAIDERRLISRTRSGNLMRKVVADTMEAALQGRNDARTATLMPNERGPKDLEEMAAATEALAVCLLETEEQADLDLALHPIRTTKEFGAHLKNTSFLQSLALYFAGAPKDVLPPPWKPESRVRELDGHPKAKRKSFAFTRNGSLSRELALLPVSGYFWSEGQRKAIMRLSLLRTFDKCDIHFVNNSDATNFNASKVVELTRQGADDLRNSVLFNDYLTISRTTAALLAVDDDGFVARRVAGVAQDHPWLLSERMPFAHLIHNSLGDPEYAKLFPNILAPSQHTIFGRNITDAEPFSTGIEGTQISRTGDLEL
jgi:hypothetical protein